MQSYQNLVVLQNLYRLKSLGFEFVDHFTLNEKTSFLKPTSIQALHKDVSSCHLCDLSKSRTQSMSGFGNINAELFLLDFNISKEQDKTNNYYVGRAGEVLKNMIEKVVNINTENIFYTHCIKCKSGNAKTPSTSEWNSCKSYLSSQIEFIKPKVIVTLGELAYEHLTEDKGNFEKVRGHIIDFKDYKIVPIYHPNHLLRNPELKKTTLNDLKTIKSCL